MVGSSLLGSVGIITVFVSWVKVALLLWNRQAKSNINVDIYFELIVQENPAEPDTQGWSRCLYCQLKKPQTVYFDTLNSSSTVVLSWSHWGEFFHHLNNDQLRGTKSTSKFISHNYVVEIPVYILPMITFHVGHILVDFLEQVYFSMLTSYGLVRKDALVIIDVAGIDERAIFQNKLDLNTLLCSIQSFGCVIRSALTNLSFYSLSALDNVSYALENTFMDIENIVFESVFSGLDTSRSFFQTGFSFHPCVMNRCCGNNDVVEASQHYQQFGDYLTSVALSATNYHEDLVSPFKNGQNEEFNILLVNRQADRVVTNLRESSIHTPSFKAIITDVFLEELTFEEQLVQFQKADILVASAGTALHNMLFMRHYLTAVVVIMQPGWCSWAWMYVNQAVLLNIQPFIYCADASHSETSDDVHYFQWSRHFWRQGPNLSKAENITLDIDKFDQIMLSARKHVKEARMSVHDGSSVQCCITDSSEVAAAFQPTSLSILAEENITQTSKRRRKLVELFVASFTVVPVVVDGDENAMNWQISIAGEIGIKRSTDSHHGGLSGMRHMCVCLQVLPIQNISVQEASVIPAWCYPIESLNYYSKLLLNVDGPVYLLHFWVQTATTGGKFQNSDVYQVIDCRMPDGGFEVLNSARNKEFLVTVDERVSNFTFIPFRLQFEKYSFQLQITDICLTHDFFGLSGCGIFAAKVARQIWFENLLVKSGMPSVQHVPTVTEPFIFLHIEKTGGTTIREFITESADSRQLTSFVPCHGGVHCVTLDLPVDNSLKNVSVVAGHFFWDVWKALPSCEPSHAGLTTNETDDVSTVNTSKRGVDTHASTSCHASCLVIGRHPIDRAISYYYQRCYQLKSCIGYQRPINDLSVEQLEFVAIHERQAAYSEDNSTLLILDEGMSNAACRSLAGVKTTSGLQVNLNSSIPLPKSLSDEESCQAMINVRKCVVGIFDRWETTLTVISEWFPWLNLHTNRARRKMFLYSGKESPEQLRPDLRDLLMRLNDCDMKLYVEMQKLFEAQVSMLSEKKKFFQ